MQQRRTLQRLCMVFLDSTPYCKLDTMGSLKHINVSTMWYNITHKTFFRNVE
jgi:hypothetical protein